MPFFQARLLSGLLLESLATPLWEFLFPFEKLNFEKNKLMGNRWKKVKLALRCIYVPDEDSSSANDVTTRLSHAPSSPCSGVYRPSQASACSNPRPTSPTPSSSGLRLSKSGTKSSTKSFKGTCAICLTTVKTGHGHAIFTAECSHSFHFHCIASNVRHGNRVCPVCRAKWKEVPFQNPTSAFPNGLSRINQANYAPNDVWMTHVRQQPSLADGSRQSSSLEPALFDDDEPLNQQHFPAHNKNGSDYASTSMMVIKTYPEVSAIPKSAGQDNFAVLVHLKAPSSGQINKTTSLQTNQDSRAPLDLVTVLDVSGSMAGTKLALVKQAMNFVIQNLGPSDRLSVIVFSSTARRVFPLKRMTDTGRQEALQVINSLVSNGGTNIAEGLKKGAKVFVDRKEKNPVGSIILLSDGQDTYTVNGSGGKRSGAAYQSLVPNVIVRNNGGGLQIPVHAFGFGFDHDAIAMHSISEMTGGTFSFIETECVIQDAFAQCIGGLLSVVVQELKVNIECKRADLLINSLKAGSYHTNITSSRRIASVDIGDLYADEERDFLVTVNVPVDGAIDEMSLLNVSCVYRDPVTTELVIPEETNEVKIHRPEVCETQNLSMEVDRQRNRLRAAEVMAEARAAAECGDLAHAVSILERCRVLLSETVSAQAGDRLCVSLAAELKEMQERMANQRVYEQSGRAYVLSGLCSHSWQRATARGDSTDITSMIQAYQTPSMVDMVNRSQTMVFGNSSHERSLHPSKSFPAKSRAANH